MLNRRHMLESSFKMKNTESTVKQKTSFPKLVFFTKPVFTYQDLPQHHQRNKKSCIGP